jgi:hypothetical protein
MKTAAIYRYQQIQKVTVASFKNFAKVFTAQNCLDSKRIFFVIAKNDISEPNLSNLLDAIFAVLTSPAQPKSSFKTI